MIEGEKKENPAKKTFPSDDSMSDTLESIPVEREKLPFHFFSTTMEGIRLFLWVQEGK